MRAITAIHRIDVVTEVEEQVTRVVGVKKCTPIVAFVADTVEASIVAVAKTRSRVPDGTCRAELTGEVDAFIGAVVMEI